MNYLAHLAVLPDAAPEVALGASLPDLVRALARRAPRLEREVARRLAGQGESGLARGVVAHQAADASFHALDAFRAGCRELAPVTEAARLAGGSVRGFFVTHVLLEILLDAALLEREPVLLDRLREALDPPLVERATRSLVGLGIEAVELPAFAARFRAARFFEDYATDEGVARRLAQVLARARQPVDSDVERAIARTVGRFRESVRERVEELTREPRSAVGTALC